MNPTAAASRDFQSLEFEYRASPEQKAAAPAYHDVVVVGAGPVGLALAIDLAQRGVAVLVLDDDHRLSTGSRAICFAKRTLEIFDRLGCGQRMAGKGVSWSVGKVFFKDAPLYTFDLLPEVGHCRPAFVNLQQYYVEGFLADLALELPNLELRWKNRVVAIDRSDTGSVLGIETPDGPYRLRAGHVIACDGSRSALRALLGLETQGRVFHDRFLIADIRTDAELLPQGATERWFWFDPPFHPNQSVLLHRQPDNVWRVDFQLGWQADPAEEKKPENIIPRVRALLDASPAKNVEFTLEWASVYTFACMRMERFRHGRVLFAGDAAHGVSPFGARGANSGVQDAENLAWKLALVVRGEAPDTLLDSYASEREFAADENIRASTRSTDFITPKTEASRLLRDAVLGLARDHPFARRLVNSGRLSVPSTLHASPLNTPDVDAFDGAMVPGAVAADAPLVRSGTSTWLLHELGPDFTLLVFGTAPIWARGCRCRCSSSARPRSKTATAPRPCATTRAPAPPICSAPTSMSARAGARPARRRCAPHSPGRARAAMSLHESAPEIAMLTTDFNLESADDFYAALIDAHRDLSPAQSHELNAKLVLLLANHIGTLAVLREALAAARANTLGAAGAAPMNPGDAS